MTTTHSDAANAAQTLAKILRLERQGNFRNRAVVGGLDAYLRRWQAQLRPVVGAPVAYADMDAEQRGRWVADTLARIGEATPDAPPGGGRASRVANPPAQSKPAEGSMPRSPTQAKPPSPSQQRPPAPAKPARKRPPRRDPAPAVPLRLDDDISRLRSVSARAKPRLERPGIQSVRDLIYHFPHRHDDFTNIRTISQLVPGEPQSLIAAVWEVTESVGRGKTKSAQAVLSDHTGNIRVIWFNQSYIKNILKPGMRVIIRGEPKVYLGRLSFQSPDYEIIGGREDDDGGAHQESLQPVYPLTDGLYQRTIRRIVKEALDAALGKVADYLPGDILRMHDLMPLRDAIARMHHPESAEQAEAARRRLAFDELLMLQLTVAQRRAQWQASGGAIPLRSDDGPLDGFLDRLPYSLTGAQSGALAEILGDMRREIPMGRLLQGDVGSGKTVVAIAALLTAALNGCQAALMAPTEILAEQHFLTAAEMLSALTAGSDAPAPPAAEVYVSVRMPSREKPLVVGLLTGSLSKRAKSADPTDALSSNAACMPLKSWDTIRPLLPLAPMHAPSDIALAMPDAVSASASCAAARVSRRVSSIFMPVSPSCTGKTLRRFTRSTCVSRTRAPSVNIASSSPPDHWAWEECIICVAVFGGLCYLCVRFHRLCLACAKAAL